MILGGCYRDAFLPPLRTLHARLCIVLAASCACSSAQVEVPSYKEPAPEREELTRYEVVAVAADGRFSPVSTPVTIASLNRKKMEEQSMLSRFLLLACLLVAGATSYAQTQGSAPTISPPTAKGLAEHDFLYAGESHDRRMFLVRQGKVVWTYDDPGGKGEISDAVMLSNGNVLFAHQFGVTEITPEKKIVWNYDTPPGHEVHTAMPIGKDRVLYIQNGNPAVLQVVNIVTHVTEHEVVLQTKHPNSTHGQFRHARLTDRGTLMVAHMDSDKVVEYDYDGRELWSFPAAVPWGVTPLANGNVLITDREGVREVTRRGDIPWSFRPSDTPAYPFTSLQQAWRLPNGNTVVNNWINEWTKTPANQPGSVQAIELTPAKQVVWVLQSWNAPANLGPATTIQFLGVGPAAEDVHFGPFY